MFSEPLDLRTKPGRRYLEICAELNGAFPSGEPLSLMGKARVRTAAALTLRLEELTARAASGAADFDPAELAKLSQITAEAVEAATPAPGRAIPVNQPNRSVACL